MIIKSMEHPPKRRIIEDGKVKTLYEGVASALSSIQVVFRSPINIEGIDATDLFSMNTLLGSAIEVQTVETLRSMRSTWDPDEAWTGYDFVRFPQSFPDVRLVSINDPSAAPVIGIELKSWYLLSKEAEPSFRYRTTAAACADCDMFVIVPWSLSNVLSGTPVVHNPFIEQASYVSDMRNFYWVNTRVNGNPQDKDGVETPEDVGPYPPPNTAITDKPFHDQGGNFGRIGRVHNLVSDWTAQCLSTSLAGIPAADWIKFLKSHTESLSTYRADIEFDDVSIEQIEDVAYTMISFCQSVQKNSTM